MNALFLIVVTFFGYIVAYCTYSRFLADKIFKLDNTRQVPSQQFNDGCEYVPTKKGVVFGHHFTSIAGTGPIVGPAIGIIWGWLPAMIWIFFGSIFMGAVHDFASLVISLRHEGKSISEISSLYINHRVRNVFFVIVFLALLIVIAIFGLVIAVIFHMFPESVFPVWAEIPIAMMLGYWMYRRKANVVLSTLVAVLAMYGTVVIGHFVPLSMSSVLGMPPTGVWTIILLLYAFLASVTPVTWLLQPRDYINAWQLYVALGLLVVGVIVSGVQSELIMVAPAVNLSPDGAPLLWPFLFITIACGAISGFHSLVSSGTTAKQLCCEQDARSVGYGSMLVEAALATIVIVAVGAGIGLAYTGSDGVVLSGLGAWQTHYSSWQASAGLASKITAFVVGSANILTYVGIPSTLGVVIVGVFVASFAGTTLDTSTRIQRYIVSELFSHTRFKWMSNRWAATIFAVVTAAALAFSSGANGKGALSLWPLFGAVNQLLAALALMVVTVYLRSKGGRGFLVAAIPCVFMVGMTVWATLINQVQFFGSGEWVLSTINGVILVLSLMMVVETVKVFGQKTSKY